LGTVYGELKNYEKAVSLLEESLKISEEGFGKDHVKTGLTLQNLAHVYLLQGQVEPAQNLTDRALKILQQSKHPELHVSLESLADIYLKKSLNAENKGDKHQSQKFKEQAITTLHKALEVTQTHFRANSPFITRIQLKINNFKGCNILDKQYKNCR
jgi:tetratricopeptide (TPR) repeat protein